MVSSLGYQLAKNRRVTGFGMARRRCATGRGIVRKVLGALSRPALTFVANKVADAISGGARRRVVRRRPRTQRASGYRLAGSGYLLAGQRRRPITRLSGLGRKRKTTTARRVTRKPRSRLGVRRTRRV